MDVVPASCLACRPRIPRIMNESMSLTSLWNVRIRRAGVLRGGGLCDVDLRVLTWEEELKMERIRGKTSLLDGAGKTVTQDTTYVRIQ